MATWKPEIFEIDGVVGFYEMYEKHAKFRIYAGHKVDPNFCRAEYLESDKARGNTLLVETLMSIKANPENTNTYLLQLLSDKKGSVTPSVTFQLNQKLQPYQPAMMGMIQPQNNAVLESRLAAMEATLQQLAANQLDDEEEEEEEEESNLIGQLLNDPQVKSMAMNLIAGLFKPSGSQQQAVAGIDVTEDEKISAALEVLKKHCGDQLGNDLIKLANMAETDPGTFKFLIAQLRK